MTRRRIAGYALLGILTGVGAVVVYALLVALGR